MDRTELSEAIIDDLGRLFVRVLKQRAATLVASDFDGIEQCLQEVGRQVFGPVVERGPEGVPCRDRRRAGGGAPPLSGLPPPDASGRCRPFP